MRAFGEIVEKEKEAEEWLQKFDEKVVKAKDSIKGLIKEGTTFSLWVRLEKSFISMVMV